MNTKRKTAAGIPINKHGNPINNFTSSKVSVQTVRDWKEKNIPKQS